MFTEILQKLKNFLLTDSEASCDVFETIEERFEREELGVSVITIKVGRHVYDIDDKDEFMDNGSCVLLLTQSKENSVWGRRPHPVLSKRAVKDIDRFDRVKTGNLTFKLKL